MMTGAAADQELERSLARNSWHDSHIHREPGRRADRAPHVTSFAYRGFTFRLGGGRVHGSLVLPQQQ